MSLQLPLNLPSTRFPITLWYFAWTQRFIRNIPTLLSNLPLQSTLETTFEEQETYQHVSEEEEPGGAASKDSKLLAQLNFIFFGCTGSENAQAHLAHTKWIA